jgi:hypothetical protein
MSPNRPGDRITVAPNDTGVRSILVGDLQMSFSDADGARVERAAGVSVQHLVAATRGYRY